jgi:hypothetical protein
MPDRLFDAGTDGAAAFTDGEAQLLFHGVFHGHRNDQLDLSQYDAR